MTLVLSEDQQAAFDEITTWAWTPEGQTAQKELTFGGLAGTGKTTLLAEIFEWCDSRGMRVNVVAPTGKAASVLRDKGLAAQTIHSLIYTPTRVGGKIEFVLDPSSLFGVNLLVVDEASMVNKVVYEDIMKVAARCKTQVLWCGDHGQLEPVGENPNLMRDPQVKLEQIHRYAGALAVFAHGLREGRLRRRAAKAATAEETLKILPVASVGDFCLEVDQVIVPFNRQRHTFNRMIREFHHRRRNAPLPGDRVICLRNNRQQGLFNGLQGVVSKVQGLNTVTADLVVTLDDGTTRDVLALRDQFFNDKTPDFVDKDVSLWDYAYAITCHKAQGSEWDRVLVVEQSCRLWDQSRWAYTAATRARKELIFCTDRA